MSKQCLDVHQMQHLQELGLELKETMLYWVVYEAGHENNFVTTKENAMEVIDESCGMLPAYTLQDVLDALPDSVEWADGKKYYLYLDLAVGFIGYDRRELPDMLTGVSFTKIPMIDAVYKLLCWVIENKFVETNKNK